MEPPQRAHSLARLFEPRGVAVIGASADPGKYGHLLLKTLIEEGYPGAIHPVNPRGGQLLGRPFVADLEAVRGPVDVALVVRPAHECPAVVAEVARRGIPFAIVYAAGFAELGEEGARLQAEMVEAARRGPTRLVGPNGMNVFSAPARLNLSAIVPFPAGSLGFLSASGNLGYAFAQEAARRGGIGFSRFVSVGNQADLALDEYLDFLRVDPATRVVILYLEGFAPERARAFLDVLARAAAFKPVLILLGGRTRPGQGTARSHTAALASEPVLLRQALRQAGAILVDRADEVLAVAQALLHCPLPKGPRVALLGEGGGHATLLSDAAAESGLTVESFEEPLIERLRPHLPPFAAIVRNPVEMGGRSEYDPRVYEKVLAEVLDAGSCDLLLLFGGYALYDEALVSFLQRVRDERGIPVLLHDLYADEERPALSRVRAAGLPLYASGEMAVRAAAALLAAGRGRERARRAGPLRGEPLVLPEKLRATLREAAGRPSRALTEQEASALLASAGVKVLPAALAHGGEEAVREAEAIGYPVVLKAHAAALVHKSDTGGVHLDLRTAEDVRRAYARALALSAEVRITPYLAGGVELIAGARRDALLGPVLLVGGGGVLAEAFEDVAVRVLPCAEAELEEMLAETRAFRLLSRPRGGAPVDAAPVVAVLRALAALIEATPEISDVEINPLRCATDGIVALDARVLVGS